MKKVTTALLGIAACFMISPAYAADPAPAATPAPTHEFQSPADTNHDGDVTKEEFHAQAQKRFDTADTNHDGKLSKDERHAAWEKHREKFTAWKAQHGNNTGGQPAAGMPPTH